MLDLRQFYVLRAIAREGSLAGAARRLHYGHPTISHHLGSLESHFRTRLVSRSPRGAELTDTGRLLLERIEVVLDLIDTTEAEVRSRSGRGLDVLRLGTFPTAAATLVPTAIAQLVDGGGVRIELVEAEPVELLERLLQRDLHCALLYDATDGEAALARRPGLVLTPLGTEAYRLVLSREHRLAADDVVDLNDLREDDWILAGEADDLGDRGLVAACRRLGFEPRVAVRSDDYAVMQSFVAAGAAVAVVPQMAVDPHQNVVRRTVQAIAERTISFASMAGRRPPIVVAIEQALVEAAW